MSAESKITPDSSIQELFDAFRPDKGCRVVPVTLKDRDDGKIDLMIAITGNQDEANIIMANLMSYVNDMHDTAEQKAAEAGLLGPDGQPVDNEPSIIVP